MTGHPPRVAVLGLWHETNTYSPVPTDLAAFEAFELLTGEAVRTHHTGTRSVIAGFLDHPDLTLVPVFSAGAWPSGTVTSAALATILSTMESQLHAAGPVDGVLLNLHGATVSEDCLDVEALVVRTIRAIVGGVPLAAVLDLHANPSTDVAGMCDVLIGYDTYPHVDMWERGQEAAGLLNEALAGRRLVTVAAKAAVLTSPLAQATAAEPMRGLQARARARAEAAGLVRISITAGFAYSDVPRAGTSVLAIADADRLDEARRVANETLRDIEDHADEFVLHRDSPEEAVRRALAANAHPVVIADVADNIGGGSPGDGTTLLAELLRLDARSATVIIADAEAVEAAARAGIGAQVRLTVGGKRDRRHGDPVPVTGTVAVLTDGRYTTGGSWMTGQTFHMGTTAVLRAGGVSIVLTERATPPFHREQLTSVGIDPSTLDVIVAKGAVAWRAAYPDAATVIEAATPGVCPIDIGTLPRTSTPLRSLA